MRRIVCFVLFATSASWACGSEPEPAGEAAATAEVALADSSEITGSYEVEGTTVEIESGRSRRIEGTVILNAKGSTYTATFALKTTYPTPDGPLPADVIGEGSGEVKGGKLRGTSKTQLVMATVPGVDTGFAFVPRHVGPRIVSSSVGSVTKDGTLTIEVENEAAPGVVYPPTRTTLRGERIPDEGNFPRGKN
jgi:hypothetical protein